jgi:hypothetical protein
VTRFRKLYASPCADVPIGHDTVYLLAKVLRLWMPIKAVPRKRTKLKERGLLHAANNFIDSSESRGQSYGFWILQLWLTWINFWILQLWLTWIQGPNLRLLNFTTMTHLNQGANPITSEFYNYDSPEPRGQSYGFWILQLWLTWIKGPILWLLNLQLQRQRRSRPMLTSYNAGAVKFTTLRVAFRVLKIKIFTTLLVA